MRHTPGPWTHRITDDGELVVDLGDRCRGATRLIYLGDMEDTEGEDHANAELIALAPELAEALIELCDELSVSGYGGRYMGPKDRATSLIARLKGYRP